MFENISASYDVGIAKKYGINCAVLLNKLIYLSRYTSRNDGYCWKTSKELEDELGLSRRQQDVAIKKLIEENLIETKNTYIIGTQIKCKHFKLLFDIDKCDLYKTAKSVNNNKTVIINNNIKEIINYLNTKLDTNYKYTTKQTQSMINARLKEGFTVEDFKKVIDKKYKEWLNTEFEQYLTPQTLFSTKFEKYLNQKTKQEVNPYEGVRVL